MVVSSKTKILSIILTAITLCGAVFWIAQVTVHRFAHASDMEYFGKKQSLITREIREAIVQQPDAELVYVPTEDRLKLAAFFFKRKDARLNILVCHGYKGCKEFLYNFPLIFPEANILMFDFRACGQSEGSFTSLGYHEYKDVLACARYLRSNTVRDLPFLIIGISMGGAATLRAASKTAALADCFVIDSSFSDLTTMFLRGYSLRVGLPYYPFFPVIRGLFHYSANCDINDVDSKDAVKKVTQPILFMHACNDSFITPDNSIRLYAQAQNPLTKIWIAPHCRHASLHIYYPETYRIKVLRFLHSTIGLDLLTRDVWTEENGEEVA